MSKTIDLIKMFDSSSPEEKVSIVNEVKKFNAYTEEYVKNNLYVCNTCGLYFPLGTAPREWRVWDEYRYVMPIAEFDRAERQKITRRDFVFLCPLCGEEICSDWYKEKCREMGVSPYNTGRKESNE